MSPKGLDIAQVSLTKGGSYTKQWMNYLPNLTSPYTYHSSTAFWGVILITITFSLY